jgi:hypothetical protein
MAGVRALGIGCLGALLFAVAALGQDAIDKALQERINRAIDKGVAYLKTLPLQTRKDLPHQVGRHALIGWTLLECGVPAKDEAVERIAVAVRDGVIDHPSNNATYSLATALIFLDKLADPSDAPLLESLTVRLLAAQSKAGGWSYGAPALSPAERERLRQVLQERRDKLAQGEKLGDKKRSPEDALADMRRYLQRLATPFHFGPTDDNSNTQFALMALWVARRHDLPVSHALAATGNRFRISQDAAGAWSYNLPFIIGPDGKQMPSIVMNEHKHPAMTCVGLIGLAVEKGAQNKTKELAKDPLVQRGLAFLGKHVDNLAGAAAPALNPAPAVPAVPNPVATRGIDRSDNYFYFLFSLERMAVLYDLKKIGKTDWYAWGAEDLLGTQAADGSWPAHYKEWNADTCFALLFLKRANIAQDLTDLVRGIDRRPKAEPLNLPLIIPKDKK